MARIAPTGIPVPDLFRRIRYDPRLERLAFRRLGQLDFSGCREALMALVEELDLSRSGAEARQIVQLLLDLLQRLNRRLHRDPDEGAIYQMNRVALIEEFAPCNQPSLAGRRFVSALHRLLAAPESSSFVLLPQVERAKRYIEDNYSRRISLSSVAEALHVSPNYLSRIFRVETGITLTAYVHRVRLEHATLLLSTAGNSISEIAYRVGYQNYRDFYRNFVKYEKTAPGQYRRHLSDAAPRSTG